MSAICTRAALRHLFCALAMLIVAASLPATAAAQSNGVAIILADTIDGARVSAGDQRRLALTLRNVSGEAFKRLSIHVLIDGGSVEVRGDGIRWRKRQGRWRGRLRSFAAEAERTAQIDVFFDPSGLSDTDPSVTGRLTVELRDRGGTVLGSASDTWTLANCSGRFHGALSQISEQHVPVLREAIKGARSGWRRLRGRWAVRPPRRIEDEHLAPVIKAARRFVRARGIDRSLRRMLGEGRPSKVERGLRRYVGQGPSPALCAGAPGYMDFFRGELADFDAAAKGSTALFERAAQAADWSLLAADRLIDGAVAGDDETKRDALRSVGRDARQLWLGILEADDARRQLLDNVVEIRQLARALGRIKLARDHVLAPARSALRQALSAIEAFAYVQGVHSNYGRIRYDHRRRAHSAQRTVHLHTVTGGGIITVPAHAAR